MFGQITESVQISSLGQNLNKIFEAVMSLNFESNRCFFPGELCKPMTSMLGGVDRENCRKFVFDAQAGLSGYETLHQFPCLFDEASSRFYVWLGDTDFSLFTKSAFMNLCNFAEVEQGAKTVVFLVYHEHRQKVQYRSMFRVIDAKRLRTDTVMELIGASDKSAAKAVTANTLFYSLDL